jgi:hypothetical protein
MIPEPGTRMGFDINDVGRVALGGPMGPEIKQVEGRLVSRTNEEYVVAVTDVHFLRGGGQAWNGESVHIKSEYVSSIYERRLLKARSVLLGTAVGGALGVIATSSLVGLAPTDRPGTPVGDTSAHTQRRPRP